MGRRLAPRVPSKPLCRRVSEALLRPGGSLLWTVPRRQEVFIERRSTADGAGAWSERRNVMKHARSVGGALLTALMMVVLQAAPSLATTLAISSFTPKTGQVGTSVVVTGSGFTGATDTAFNGTSATFTVNSDTKITTSVPTGATTGPISVTTPAGTATSASIFKVVPTITGFSPPSGQVGAAVTITGTAFTGAIGVRFNGTPAAYTVDSYSQITATVPVGAMTGPIRVQTPGGSAITSTSFIVTTPTVPPTPTTGPPGPTITVSGSGFGSSE